MSASRRYSTAPKKRSADGRAASSPSCACRSHAQIITEFSQFSPTSKRADADRRRRPPAHQPVHETGKASDPDELILPFMRAGCGLTPCCEIPPSPGALPGLVPGYGRQIRLWATRVQAELWGQGRGDHSEG